ncbi:PREDICTED: FGFR1 oncogene partner [Tinamus guttatus]|uniref:FGFR1 oncogene partner n=1 Tax=Tinamus guttatus TaxID=94827 RepID=UPI00052E9022|nr:PREDICTED: FGFR1 oncogene partner [Tinamus guttatus]
MPSPTRQPPPHKPESQVKPMCLRKSVAAPERSFASGGTVKRNRGLRHIPLRCLCLGSRAREVLAGHIRVWKQEEVPKEERSQRNESQIPHASLLGYFLNTVAELRAAVFLALEEQEKVENKTPLVNESLKNFLSTKDGRLVAGLVAEFLHYFNLDFTLAVFQPESSTLNGLDGRENLARDLGIIEAEGTVGGPLLLELVRKCQQKKISSTGEVAPVLSDSVCPSSRSSDGRSSSHPVPSKIAETTESDTSVSSGEATKGSIHFLPNETKLDPQLQNKDLNTKEKSDPGVDEDDAEGDSFFDDPIPKPERTYGWKTESSKAGGLASLSDAPPLKSGVSSLTSPLLKDCDDLNRNSVLKDLRLVNAKLGSLELGNGDEDEYADDFNSASLRSEKSDISIGEEIDEISVETEDLNASDKLEDMTQDLTISQLSDAADYLEDVA